MTLLFRVIKSEDTVYEKIRPEPEKKKAAAVVQAADEHMAKRMYEEMQQRASQSAAKILEEAYAKRDRIVSTAEEDTKRVRQKAVQDGYQEGIKKAASRLEQDLRNLETGLNRLRAETEQNMELLRADLIELSLEMAEKILHKELEEDDEAMKELVHAVIRSEKDKKHIRLKLSGEMMHLIDQLDQELEPVRERYQNTIKVAAVQMPAGTCRAETEEGITDASVFVQLDNLRKQLSLLEKED